MLWMAVASDEIVRQLMSMIKSHVWNQQRAIVRRYIYYSCIDIPYIPGRGYCGETMEGACIGQRLRIHYNQGLSPAERAATSMTQLFDQRESLEGDGYALSSEEFEAESSIGSLSSSEDESSSMDLPGTPRCSSDSSGTSGSRNGFENYV
jgi:hypothetical protein